MQGISNSQNQLKPVGPGCHAAMRCKPWCRGLGPAQVAQIVFLAWYSTLVYVVRADSFGSIKY